MPVPVQCDPAMESMSNPQWYQLKTWHDLGSTSKHKQYERSAVVAAATVRGKNETVGYDGEPTGVSHHDDSF